MDHQAKLFNVWGRESKRPGDADGSRVRGGTVMKRLHLFLIVLSTICLPVPLSASQLIHLLRDLLGRSILDPRQPLVEAQVYIESRVPSIPIFQNRIEWEQYASSLRRQVLEQVIFRGEASRWRDAKTNIEWMETISGGSGYHIKKLRYEAVPGLWIPALLYEPEKVREKVPAILNVSGHEKLGKATPHLQICCINQAKRGMFALSIEWFKMGQLNTLNFDHDRINQLDLCGTSGIALHYLYLRRAIDVLLSLQHADPNRLAVTGLSGGAWQTIFISSLDQRIRLASPVAGYSSFVTGAQFPELDIADSEQMATDLASVVDYTHLTAMMAPRPTLLIYNAKDNCCYRAEYALGPLLAAATPIFGLYGATNNLRYHINWDPGHNYERDNRETFYRMLRDFFFGGSPEFDVREISCNDELRTAQQLHVDLPADNADIHKLALEISKHLPVHPGLPDSMTSALEWQDSGRAMLQQIVRLKQFEVEADKIGNVDLNDLIVNYWRLRMSGIWSVPVVELVSGEPRSTTILVADGGRVSIVEETKRLLAEGQRVVTVDPFYLGESKIQSKEALGLALLVSALGDRPLGLQAGQILAIARWLQKERHFGPVIVEAIGPKSSILALVAAALEKDAIAGLNLHHMLGSLKEVIEQNLSEPELFCFGLLEAFDIKQLVALVVPRPVSIVVPSDRVMTELDGLRKYYNLFGIEFDPLKDKRR